jgi:hypothetical protein
LMPVQLGGPEPRWTGTRLVLRRAGIWELCRGRLASPVIAPGRVEGPFGTKRAAAHWRGRCEKRLVLPTALLELMRCRSSERYRDGLLAAAPRSPSRSHIQDRSAAIRHQQLLARRLLVGASPYWRPQVRTRPGVAEQEEAARGCGRALLADYRWLKP